MKLPLKNTQLAKKKPDCLLKNEHMKHSLVEPNRPSCPICYRFLDHEGQEHECLRPPILTKIRRGPEYRGITEIWDSESFDPVWE